MNLPSNVKIEFPFVQCEGCNRCEPTITIRSDDIQNLMSQNLNYVSGYHYTEYYIVNCRNEDACKRLVDQMEELKRKFYEEKDGEVNET